jgi:four helix bundle protein
MNKWKDLNDRFVDFAVCCLTIADKLPKSYAGNHIAGQLTRSGTAPALLYGEVQGAESKADFIHKFKIALKELRETANTITIIEKMEWLPGYDLQNPLRETNELIAISVKSIQTARNSSQSKS